MSSLPIANVLLSLAFLALLIPVTVIDLERRIIPNKLLIVGTFIALIILGIFNSKVLPEHLLAGVIASGLFLVTALLCPQGLGMGDVKLIGVMGIYLGVQVAVALSVALVAGVIFGLAMVVRKGWLQGRKTAFAFGPMLAFGGLVTIFAGSQTLDAYASLLR